MVAELKLHVQKRHIDSDLRTDAENPVMNIFVVINISAVIIGYLPLAKPAQSEFPEPACGFADTGF